jgi:zona occludens toxin
VITLLQGPSGAGKSYEALITFVMPALEKGRKVRTNLPIIEDALRRFVSYPFGLLEIHEDMRHFKTVENFTDEWRHPETNQGPLYVIDEAQLVFPKGNTPRDVEEWFSLHRHYGADVVLLTQNYRRLSAALVDNVQTSYRLRKATALGTTDRYFRITTDGVRGARIRQQVVAYDRRYFGLWLSHTQSDSVVHEDSSSDIIPIWKRWPFVGAAVMLLLAGGLAFRAATRSGESRASVSAGVRQVSRLPAAAGAVGRPAAAPAAFPAHSGEPYDGFVLYLKASAWNAKQRRYAWLFAVTQNGQEVFEVTGRDLTQAGYAVEPVNPCVVRLHFAGSERYVTCGVPTVKLGGMMP